MSGHVAAGVDSVLILTELGQSQDRPRAITSTAPNRGAAATGRSPQAFRVYIFHINPKPKTLIPRPGACLQQGRRRRPKLREGALQRSSTSASTTAWPQRAPSRYSQHSTVGPGFQAGQMLTRWRFWKMWIPGLRNLCEGKLPAPALPVGLRIACERAARWGMAAQLLRHVRSPGAVWQGRCRASREA